MTILDRPPRDWKRPGTPPLFVQVAVLLRQLGLQGKTVNWDHRPPLSERRFDVAAWDTIPPAQDPACIDVLTDVDHDRRTNGPGGEKRITTLGSDTHNRKRTRDLTADQAEFVRKMLHKRPGRRRPRKNTFGSRPFGTRRKKSRRR